MSALTVSAELAASVQRMRARTGSGRHPGVVLSADDSTCVVIDIARRIGQARRVKEIDAIGAHIWHAASNGAISESAAIALDRERRCQQAEQLVKWENWQHVYGPRVRAGDDTRPHDERRAERLLRNRKRLAQRRAIWRLGWVPNVIAANLTPGEEAVAAIYAEDNHRKGYCDDSKAQIATRAGVCERVVVRAQNRLADMRAISRSRRERKGNRHDPTIVHIIDGTWLLWLRNRKVKPRRGEGDCANRERGVSLQIPPHFNKAAGVESQKRAIRGVSFAKSGPRYGGIRR